MPTPGTRSPRLASVAIALFLAACSGGGGGGGGSAAPGSGSGAAGSTSVTLGWSKAVGPVAGYSVYVQREDGAFKHELDVSSSSVTLRGAPGTQARVSVVAFDNMRTYGPTSPSSPVFTFPDPDASAPAAALSAGSGGDEVASGGGSSGSEPVGDPAPSPSPSPTPTPPVSTLPGTLVWQAGDGFRLTDAELVTKRLFARPYDGAQLAGMADFDADGQGDLLWVGAAAQLGFTSGSALRGADPVPLVDLGALATDEHVLGAGDFDGDGDGDVLVATGDAVRAHLTEPDAASAVNELGTASQAVLAGIADFDGNGSEDIAWRASTGALVLWMMDGGSLSATVEVALESGYQPLGAGDFDGDGAAEFVLRGPDGHGYGVHPLAAQPQLEATDLDDVVFWNAVGAADLDQDGSEELVLAMAAAIRIAGLPGDLVSYVEDDSPWQLVALLP
jgi:hypothetical protein